MTDRARLVVGGVRPLTGCRDQVGHVARTHAPRPNPWSPSSTPRPPAYASTARTHVVAALSSTRRICADGLTSPSAADLDLVPLAATFSRVTLTRPVPDRGPTCCRHLAARFSISRDLTSLECGGLAHAREQNSEQCGSGP